MFEKIAAFWLVQQRAPLPATKHFNDNPQGFRRPRGTRRIPTPVLACHWNLIDGVLTCQWEVECAQDPERPGLQVQKLAA